MAAEQPSGQARHDGITRIVEVGAKPETSREATAEASGSTVDVDTPEADLRALLEWMVERTLGEADQEYAFSVYSMLQVGTEDLKLEVKSHLDKNGTLIVEQLMTNNAEQLADFKCILRARGHRRCGCSASGARAAALPTRPFVRRTAPKTRTAS